VGLIRDRLARPAASIGLAVLAAALLVGVLVRSGHRFDDRLADDEFELGFALDHSTTPAIGFWLMMVVLAALVAGNAVALVRAWRPRRFVEPDRS
jgi:hypothetical protein